ncbi:MAG: hypothetical protein LBS90_06205 [Oscillospiraceae bacterium]|jgi:ABC-2 type transport system permease protein|nr:hypothetical protein [Oscillospiraceae bacterium]
MAGFSNYFRFILKRERAVGLTWFVCMVAFEAGLASVFSGMFSDAESMRAMAFTMNTPAMVALMGPVYGLESLTPAIIMAQECLVWFFIAAAVMNIFFVVRHTRADEELGRHEMLRALPVGRLTGAASTLTGAFALNAAITLASALGLIALNADGATAAGAFAYALSIGAVGFLFAALTLLFAQLFSTPRGVSGAAFAVMGVFYVLRMSGDMNGNALSAVSPMGLGLKVQPFWLNGFAPVVILLTEAAVVAAAALAVCANRDLGGGIIPARKGKARASRFLRGEFGLAWRLSRGTIFAWSAGIFALGATYGAAAGTIDQFAAGNEMFSKMLASAGAASVADSYTAMVFAIGALLCSVPVINIAGKIRAEEKRGRLEQILAKSVPRERMFLSYIALAFVTSLATLALMAIGFYIAAGGMKPGALLTAAFEYLPALWLMLGLTVLLAGAVPKLAGLIWAVFAYAFAVFYFGKLLRLPELAAKLSPFGYIPQLPSQEFALVPLLVPALLAVAVCAAGVAGFGRRDVG